MEILVRNDGLFARIEVSASERFQDWEWTDVWEPILGNLGSKDPIVNAIAVKKLTDLIPKLKNVKRFRTYKRNDAAIYVIELDGNDVAEVE